MLKIKSFFLFFLFTALISCSKEDPSPSSEAPTIFAVETANSEIPYLQISTKTDILNEPKVAASMTVYVHKKKVLDSPIGIEYRGSTSYRISDKKSFGIETRDLSGAAVNLSVLGFPAESDWILTGDVFKASDNIIFDPSLMHHYIGYDWYAKMGHYASRSKFVELEVNGVYLGVYVFMEKLKRGSDRINVKKLVATDTDAATISGGYILKIDKTSGSEVGSSHPLDYYLNNWDDDCRYTAQNSFRSDYDIFGQPMNAAPYGAPYSPQKYLETYFLYDYPKAENINDAQKNYIQTYIHNFETALLTDDFSTDSRSYTNYIDRASFIDFFIINEVCGNVDGYRLSTYMHKERGEKLKMGPIWDLNIGFNLQDRVPFNDWIINYNTYVTADAWMVPFWWKRLMEDPQFRTELKARWIVLRSNVLSSSNVLALTDMTSSYLTTNDAIKRNYTKWTGINVDYNSSMTELKAYLRNRLDWMDSKILGY